LEEIKHVIKDEMGMHARPAGQLVKCCGGFKCDIQIGTSAKMANAKRIMAVMALALKHTDELTMTFDGPDKKEAAGALKSFLDDNL
jgi:phosphocarrier protein